MFNKIILTEKDACDVKTKEMIVETNVQQKKQNVNSVKKEDTMQNAVCQNQQFAQ